MPPPKVAGAPEGSRKWRFLLSVLDGKQYLRFGPPREIIEILDFCSRSLPGSIISKSCFLHLSKTPSKKLTIWNTEIIKNPQVFIAKWSIQGPQIQVPKRCF